MMKRSYSTAVCASLVTTLGFSLGVHPVALANPAANLPRPNRQGDFTAANANTHMSETNGLVTWLNWRVVSQDGELNCRATPNGAIRRVYRTGSRLTAETRGANAIVLSNGSPWMLTRDRCYVRANSRYIQPI